jgi:hypothetical protein
MSSVKNAFFMIAVAAFSASGQATRTWVSGVGDDANPCSRTAPCKTFAGAVSKTAAGGEINALDPGGFGTLAITKSIRIDGSATIANVLANGTHGIVINAGSNDIVVLRGITIKGDNVAGTQRGIRFISGKQLIIENCEIYGFGQRNISIEPTVDSSVSILDTNVNAGVSNGVMVQPQTGVQARVTLDNVRITNNANYGLLAYPGGSVLIRNSVISHNGLSGVRVDGSTGSTTVDLDTTALFQNGTGITVVTGGAATTRISNSTIVGNGVGLDGLVTSFSNNRIVGNGTGNGPPSSTLPLQ